MDIQYSSNRLSSASTSLSEAIRFLGEPVGRKYIQRIAVLRATGKFSELFGHRALRLHRLKGPRAGQHSILLTGNYRLILEKVDEDSITILGVEDYHGD